MNLRNNLRIFWLWLKHEYYLALTACTWCHRRGITHTSVPTGDVLCHECGNAYEKSMEKRGQDLTLNFVKEYGYKELYRQQSEFKDEPRAYGLVENNSEEEIPCFDTFPNPAPLPGRLLWDTEKEAWLPEAKVNVGMTITPEEALKLQNSTFQETKGDVL